MVQEVSVSVNKSDIKSVYDCVTFYVNTNEFIFYLIALHYPIVIEKNFENIKNYLPHLDNIYIIKK